MKTKMNGLNNRIQFFKKNCYAKKVSLVTILKDEGWRVKYGGTFSHDQVSAFPRGFLAWSVLVLGGKKD